MLIRGGSWWYSRTILWREQICALANKIYRLAHWVISLPPIQRFSLVILTGRLALLTWSWCTAASLKTQKGTKISDSANSTLKSDPSHGNALSYTDILDQATFLFDVTPQTVLFKCSANTFWRTALNSIL